MFRALTTTAAGLATLALLAPTPAEACGGFFCNQDPIDQSKEKIIFAIDEVEQKVEVHVQVFYQGTADRFAWIVPVPTVPEVLLSTDALFQNLTWQTQPYFNLNWEERGRCEYDGFYGYPTDALEDAPSAGGAEDDGDRGVDVLASGQTGPYDWVVLDADSQAALLAWLADPDGVPATADQFDIPASVGDALGTYLSGGSKFVAFKLTKESDVGDIAPIRLQYAGTDATIPLILTSIAAVPDMRLETYVFANKRAVPENYLHVHINEAKINWLSGGSNYEDVITMAADEAGGQAFATDFYGPTTNFRGQLYSEGRFDLARLRTITSPAQFVSELLGQGFPPNVQMQNLIRSYIPMPQVAVDAGLDEASFYNCLDCYPEYTSLVDFDPVAFVEELDEVVVTPMREAETLYAKYSHISRMTSSVSPEEMDLDPLFVLNPDMTSLVNNNHQATLVIDCGDGGKYSEADRFITLSDGTVIQLPPDAWFQETGTSYEDWLAGEDQPAAILIERTGRTGQPEPIADNSGEVSDLLDAYNNWVLDLTGRGADIDSGAQGCGCTSGATPAGGAGVAFGLLGLLGLRRRRS